MPDASFVFSGRTYKARLLVASKPGQTTAIVYGLGLNPKLDRVYVIYKASETVTAEDPCGWWSPKGRLSPLMRAAVSAASPP